MTFEEFKARRDDLALAVSLASAALADTPRDRRGLTPDHVKFSIEYRTLKIVFNLAFKDLRAFNMLHVKTFAKELLAERKRNPR